MQYIQSSEELEYKRYNTQRRTTNPEMRKRE